jgi:osmotically-inducible protein OsmY
MEYAAEVYGPGWESPGYGPGEYGASGPGGAPRPRHLYKYPPGPKGYQRSDERIREDICDRLMRAANHIDSSEVTVEVAQGKVLLEGTVPARRMKHAIEDLADGCLGVKDIENRIRVQPPLPEG